ncbi:hypothetical protein LCGC14_1658620 [marine sediment metagenome]|uniref:Uncharacterized protein n=1 Tax=marine sediment metagenome TaxID=412755 RepID=A0A0F9HUS2_9ZZZZ
MTRKIPYWKVTLCWTDPTTGALTSGFNWAFAYTPSGAVVQSLAKWAHHGDALQTEIRENLCSVEVIQVIGK